MNTIEQTVSKILALGFPEVDASAAKTLCYLIGDGSHLHRNYRTCPDFISAVRSYIPDCPVDDPALIGIFQSFLTPKERFNDRLLTIGFSDDEVKTLSQRVSFSRCKTEDDVLREFSLDFWRRVQPVLRNYPAVDCLAEAVGIPNSDPNRYFYIISGTVADAEENGCSCVPVERLMKEFRKRNLTPDEEQLRSACGTYFSVDHDSVYRTQILDYEVSCAAKLTEFMENTQTREVNISLPDIETILKKKLNEEQIECIHMIEDSGIKVVTGGAGTGKSSVISAIVLAAQQSGLSVQVCSTTGKAANQIVKYFADVGIDKKISTVHHLFGIDPSKEILSAGKSCNADILIIDEASMLGLDVFSAVLSKTPADMTVILVGDTNQLPPVEVGNVFDDLIGSKMIPVVRLKTTYRQDSGSGIIRRNAQRILDGDTDLETDENFRILQLRDRQSMGKIIECYQNSENAAILCPVYRGFACIDMLNEEISQLNMDREHKKDFRVGDRVITQRSGYRYPYFYGSGEIGSITEITNSEITVRCDAGHMIRVSTKNRDDLDFAYAISIHKSQGSEFDDVIIVLPNEKNKLLYRKLLYTAVTRAKKRVTVFASKPVLEYTIKRKQPERTGHLIERIHLHDED